ncbi:hypothetical protein SynPROS91_02344 [Synechococcus sp. PROS-9-1]|nr:hypothetical protein SynPROS91_02344 [Synechococcus sp. PROS-9-1]
MTVGKYGNILTRMVLAGGTSIRIFWIPIREWAMDNLN